MHGCFEAPERAARPPLPLAGRGRGWGCPSRVDAAVAAAQSMLTRAPFLSRVHPTPNPSPSRGGESARRPCGDARSARPHGRCDRRGCAAPCGAGRAGGPIRHRRDGRSNSGEVAMHDTSKLQSARLALPSPLRGGVGGGGAPRGSTLQSRRHSRCSTRSFSLVGSPHP